MIEPDAGTDPMPPWRFESAELVCARGMPYWVVHAHDNEHGGMGSWVLDVKVDEHHFEVKRQAWIPGAVQAIVGDRAGCLWAVTADGTLVTNKPMSEVEGWSALGDSWYARRIDFEREGAAVGEVAVCLLWTGHELLIGTFSRRIYCWTGAGAGLEYDGGAPDFAGGINDLVEAGGAVHALGYGGTLMRREGKAHWSPLRVPWAPDDAAYINVVAGTAGNDGQLVAVLEGGWVLEVERDKATPTHKLAAKPFGIVTFQGNLYVATMDGCYQLLGAGRSTLIRGDIGMGKMIVAGRALFAIDAAPDDPDRAGLHVWLRTRLSEQWMTKSVGLD